MIRRLLVSFALVSAAVVSPAVAAPAKHGASVQANKQDKDSYTVELKAAGSYKKGVEGTVELVLTPKGGHHVNPDYPAKFKVKDAEGITFPKKVLERKDGDFKETSPPTPASRRSPASSSSPSAATRTASWRRPTST
jgi:hypothetical protein